MKRIGFLYEKVAALENIKLAIKNSSKRKRRKAYVAKILQNTDKYAMLISEMLINHTFKPGQVRRKTIYDKSCGKPREISIPPYYPDQIIHWAVMQIIQPIIKRGMYKYCCGSVPRRGGMAAKREVKRVLRKSEKVKYILKLDVKKFFPSINQSKLLELLATKIKDKKMLSLLSDIVHYGGAGLPIGFYTSQWFSNFYLERLDHFIKQSLRVYAYVRYVDDMVLFGANKRRLRSVKISIDIFLSSYDLNLKDNWQLWKVDGRPLEFVGYRFTCTYTTPRKKTFYKLMRSVRAIAKWGLNIIRARQFMSYMGWFKHINFKKYYREKIAPIITRRAARNYISRYDRKIRRLAMCAAA